MSFSNLLASTPAVYLADIPPVVGGHQQQGVSLSKGWFPWAVEILAVLALSYAISGRARTTKWWLGWLPVILVLGAAAAGATSWVVFNEGLADDPAPSVLWFWTGASAVAALSLVLGFRGQRWSRRTVAVLAVPLCLLATGVVVNQWVGYFKTVQGMWGELTAGPLPGQIDAADLPALQGTAQISGKVVPVDIPDDVSGFAHRTEYVWLPPAWFRAKTPPQLPVVMMVGGEFNTPADWLRVGEAAQTADSFAAAHDGNAPIMVFVDTGGSFNNDTECVNGTRGNSEDHLVQDVRPYVVRQFGASGDPAQWGVAGFSMGGTCAVDLAVKHPDLFSGFVDIAGDSYPDAGDKQQTIARLFGGNAAAFNAYDPAQVMAAIRQYKHTAGWFEVSSDQAKQPAKRVPQVAAADVNVGFGGVDPSGNPNATDHLAAARQLCAVGEQHGITCAVVTRPGGHNWEFASATFAQAFSWLAGYLRTPDAPQIALPGRAD